MLPIKGKKITYPIKNKLFQTIGKTHTITNVTSGRVTTVFNKGLISNVADTWKNGTKSRTDDEILTFFNWYTMKYNAIVRCILLLVLLKHSSPKM